MSALTEWAASLLETDEEILVPVKKLWKEYSQMSQVSLDEFTHALEGDARFEFFEGTDHTKGFEDWSEEELAEYEEEMEAEGFFSGPRVKLKSREITPDHIAKMIKKHTDRMMSALWAAYDIRPEDLDEQSEQELLDMIVRAKEFQLKAQDAIKPDDEGAEKENPR